MIYLINDIEKVYVPEGAEYEEVKIVINVQSLDVKRKIIVSEIPESEGRQFGGAFVKLAQKGESYRNVWISSTLNEQELATFVSQKYGIAYGSLFRYW